MTTKALSYVVYVECLSQFFSPVFDGQVADFSSSEAFKEPLILGSHLHQWQVLLPDLQEDQRQHWHYPHAHRVLLAQSAQPQACHGLDSYM